MHKAKPKSTWSSCSNGEEGRQRWLPCERMKQEEEIMIKSWGRKALPWVRWPGRTSVEMWRKSAGSQLAVQKNRTSPEEECASYVWGPAVRPEWVTKGCWARGQLCRRSWERPWGPAQAGLGGCKFLDFLRNVTGSHLRGFEQRIVLIEICFCFYFRRITLASGGSRGELMCRK